MKNIWCLIFLFSTSSIFCTKSLYRESSLLSPDYFISEMRDNLKSARENELSLGDILTYIAQCGTFAIHNPDYSDEILKIKNDLEIVCRVYYRNK